MLRTMGFWIAIYPVVAHIGLWTSHPRFAVSYLIGLLLIVLLYPPRYLKFSNLITATILMFGASFLVKYNLDYILIYLPPIIIPAILMVLFMQSLQSEKTPLITRFARKIEGDLDADKTLYTRRITIVWTCVFAFMVVEATMLAIWAPIEIWSWFAYIGNYLLIAIILIIEFIYRQHRFESSNINFKQFVIMVVKYNWK